MRHNQYGTIISVWGVIHSSEWAIFPNECSGAQVVKTAHNGKGSSYVEFMADIDEEDYKKLLTWESMWLFERSSFLHYLKTKYQQKDV